MWARLDGAMVKALAFGPENPSLNLRRNPCLQGVFFGAIHLEKELDGAPPVWFFHQQVVLREPASSPPMHWKGQEELLDTSHAIDLWWLWEQMSPHPNRGWGPVRACKLGKLNIENISASPTSWNVDHLRVLRAMPSLLMWEGGTCFPDILSY